MLQFIGRTGRIKKGRVTNDMSMEEFALSVLESFDFDITKHCIVDSKYLSSPGGLNVIETYFNNDLALTLPALQTAKPGTAFNLLMSDTLDRAEKYVGR